MTIDNGYDSQIVQSRDQDIVLLMYMNIEPKIAKPDVIKELKGTLHPKSYSMNRPLPNHPYPITPQTFLVLNEFQFISNLDKNKISYTLEIVSLTTHKIINFKLV